MWCRTATSCTSVSTCDTVIIRTTQNNGTPRVRVIGGKGLKSTVTPWLVLSSIVLLLTACSTEKAKWGNIKYHNTTCHYNVWWNGNESLKEGRKKLHDAVVDDYTQLLLVENLGTNEQAKTIFPEMNRAVEKGVKGIKKHSIYIKGTEHVPYIKECYLMTAYATFYMQDYASTVNSCDILVNQFKGTRAGDEGAVLMARCATQEKRYGEAEAALDQLVQNLDKGNFTRSQRDKLYKAMVEVTVPQEKYKKAVEYIHLALESSSVREDKARLTFIMAQIYQKLGKRAVAAKYYHQAGSLATSYVMEFNAKLGEASCADLEHTDVKRIEKQLDEMLRDKKNEEYRDQIYYAKGEMMLGVKQPREACDNFRRSVAVATVNKAQKAKSALRMGEVLYDVFQDYDHAQRYYDTAMQNISKDYPGYDRYHRRYETLTELVSYTRTYQRCDSLVAVAALPEGERMALINAKIDTLRRQEQEAKERALMEEYLNDAKAQQNTLTGDWYFYNPQTVQKGKETFRQRWGMRPLEDLWFLNNKTVIMTIEEEPLADSDTAAADTLASSSVAQKANDGNPNDPHSPAYYLKDLPTSQQALDSIDTLVASSLLNAGYIYYDGVRDIPRAVECYTRLAEQYTTFPETEQAFYMLYRVYDKQGNTPQANYYRDMVLMGFPDGDFANLIRDNEYYKELLRRDKSIEEDYETLYTHYADGHYGQVITLAEEASERYPGNPVQHKFNYWKGLAQARRGDRESALASLEAIVAQTAQTDTIHPLALAQLNRLRSDTALAASRSSETITEADEQRVRENGTSTPRPSAVQAPGKEDDLPPEAQVYRFRERQQYYVIIVVNDKHIEATELQYKIVEFNNTYYPNSGYKVNASLFTDSTQVLTIHRFVNADEAINYWRHLGQETSPLRQYADGDHREIPISTQNYATFYNRKNFDAYEAFFKKYYLK